MRPPWSAADSNTAGPGELGHETTNNLDDERSGSSTSERLENVGSKSRGEIPGPSQSGVRRSMLSSGSRPKIAFARDASTCRRFSFCKSFCRAAAAPSSSPARTSSGSKAPSDSASRRNAFRLRCRKEASGVCQGAALRGGGTWSRQGRPPRTCSSRFRQPAFRARRGANFVYRSHFAFVDRFSTLSPLAQASLAQHFKNEAPRREAQSATRRKI